MKIRDLRRSIIDDYAVIPFLLCGVGQMTAFYLVRLINRLVYGPVENYFDITTKLDRIIPVVPKWVIVYILSYVFWLVSYLWVSKESKEVSNRFLTADMLGKVLCAVIFVAFPTTNTRLPLPSEDWARPVLELIYFLDSPDNLFPSMHCSVSWFAVRYVCKSKKIPMWYKCVSVVMTLLVFLSVLFTKQHVVIDIFGGIAVAELSIQISERTNLYKLYDKLDVVGSFYDRRDKRKAEKGRR